MRSSGPRGSSFRQYSNGQFLNVSQMMTTAREAASAAGDILSRYFRDGFGVRSKGPSDLVTDADVAAEQCIAEVIAAQLPDHHVLAEESHKSATDVEHLWVVDPLDGTTNFAHGIPHFAVSIAYCHHGTVQCGVVFNPIRGDWYTAERGQGAFHNDQPLRATRSTSLSEVLVGTGFYYDRGQMMEATLAAIRDCFLGHIHGIRRFGTASLDLAQVASGHFGGYFEFELNAWDFAAGQLLVQEAGGIASDCHGNPLPLGKSSVMAAGPDLHQELLQITSQHVPKSP